jgi:hypothetical protein
MRLAVFICLAALGLLRPLLVEETAPRSQVFAFSGWPAQFEGKGIVQLPLSEREKSFARDFPGQIGRFTDGEREIILRWIAKESRKLHPASDCLKGAGFAVRPLPLTRDTQGNQWNCVQASRQDSSARVCERIYDGKGKNWSDTSTWFWDALLGNTQGPWWAATVADSRPI